MSREALYIGINHYDSEKWPLLSYCENDARSIAELLYDSDGGYDWSSPEKSLLLGSSARESRMLDQVKALFADADGNDILFYFSGHADKLKRHDLLLASVEDDPDKDDERHGLRFSDLMKIIKQHPQVNTVTVILDCCHAGSIKNIDVPRNVVVLAAARENQQAAELGDHGIFTASLLAGLQGGSADIFGNVTAVSLYADASMAITSRGARQQPVLKACLDKIIVLRHTQTGISRKQLRLLYTATDPRPEKQGCRIFSRADKKFHPYPEMEKSTASEGKMRTGQERPDELTPSMKLMEDFKIWRDAHLVNIDADDGNHDLYWACIKGGTISLTLRGQYYWNLAAKGLI
ncbi:caspase family protein [Bifidobacterium sp. ESL0728]|uniref:caspase family protein n=1 Tax=Bifidobacterium sp. ESL0728 TaxID=2983220 RepID=UPI0023F6B1F7|nr:caspase family protein [Bifidobacterium sp. ESL0728]WEV59386.1 caspase family protein [Bifidobacterium sp. ESL0728]